MPKADETITTPTLNPHVTDVTRDPSPLSRRRTLFAAVGAVLMGTGVTAGAAASVADLALPEPDAELIHICHEIIAVERAWQEIYDGSNPITDEDEALAATVPLDARMDVLLDEMERLHAVTAAGILARGHALAVHNGDFGGSFDHPETIAGRLLACLMRDAAAIAGRA